MVSDKRCFNSNGRFGRFFAEMAPWVVLSIAGCRRRLGWYVLICSQGKQLKWNLSGAHLAACAQSRILPSINSLHQLFFSTAPWCFHHLEGEPVRTLGWTWNQGLPITRSKFVGNPCSDSCRFHGIVSKAVLCIETKHLLVVVELLKEVSPSG